MIANWKEVMLGDVCNIIPGFAFKSKDWSEEGIPVLKIKNITSNNTVDLSDVDCVPSDLLSSKLERFILKDGDIVLAMTGATAGKVGKLRTDEKVLLNQRVAKIEPVHADRDFIWAVVSSKEYQRRFFHLADGAAQPNMSGSQIEGVPLRLPPIGQQHRIGQFIASYDNLIDVNHRRIALLEEMTRRLFEEWFVHFRFPDHESHSMVESPQGLMPEGWRRVRLDEVAFVNNRTIRPDTAPAQIGYVDISSVTRGEVEKVDWMRFSDAPGRARRKVQDGSIIWSTVRPNRRSYALIFDPSDDLIVSTGFAVLDAHAVSAAYLYRYTTTDDFVGYLVGNATGAAYPAVTGAVFERAFVLVPPPEIDQQFNSMAGPALRLIGALYAENSRLAASRDLLVPRLISGSFSLPTAEQELEAVA
jgi:type I restriction enzyme S subunit